MSAIKQRLLSFNKEASVSQLSAIAEMAESGELGPDAQATFEGIMSAYEGYVQDDLTEKSASAGETDYTIYDEAAARDVRLQTLLREY